MTFDPLSMMEQESRPREGRVPRTLADGVEVPGEYRLVGCEFLSRGRDFAIHYRRGEGVRYELVAKDAGQDMELVLAGSVRSAIAAINGLFPLHASAVVVAGRVFAFCGPAGAGKSTLVAALNARSVPLYCDDTLLLDPACIPPLCLPGHKRLKLWPDAADLAGARTLDLVSPTYRKFYCSAGGGDVAEPLPLGGIISLEQGDDIALAPLKGGARIAALAHDHYTLHLHQLAQGYEPQDRLSWLARIGSAVPVHRFTRPFDAGQFAAWTDFLMQQLEGLCSR
jgi:hypothetical protein